MIFRMLSHFSFSCGYDVKPATIKKVSALEISKVSFHYVNTIILSYFLFPNCLFEQWSPVKNRLCKTVTTKPTTVDCVISVHEDLLSLSFWHDSVTFVFFSIPSVTLGRLHMSRQLLKYFTSSEANVLFCLQMCMLKRRNRLESVNEKEDTRMNSFYVLVCREENIAMYIY